MSIWTDVFMEFMFRDDPPKTTSDQDVAQFNVRRALFTEISFIKQTIDSIYEMSYNWEELTAEDKEEFRRDFERIYHREVDEIVKESALTKQEFYAKTAKNIGLMSVSHSIDGRLSTVIYHANADQIGILSPDEITAVINVYSAIIALKDCMENFEQNLRVHGILPSEYLPSEAAAERELLIEGIEQLSSTLQESLEPTRDTLINNM